LNDKTQVPVSRATVSLAPGSWALDIRGLVKLYGERRALDGVGFSVATGKIFALLGPNGGGKSTLFRVLSTLTHPDEGSACVLGHDVVKEPHAVRSLIGVVFQNPSLDVKLKVRENLEYQGALYGLSGQELARRIDELLERFHLADRAEEIVEMLSGGLARRVEIAKGLLHKPRLLLLDEPSTGLDPGARRELWNQLVSVREEDGTSIILTTHILEEAEGCDRIVLLDRGRIVAEGSPEELKAEVAPSMISIRCGRPEELRVELGKEWGLDGRVVHDTVRIPTDKGPEFVAELAEALGDKVRSIAIGQATLEDVFLARTGVDFGDRDQQEAEEAALRSRKRKKR
jgi:ABC-2 type transport system ATP-binding protein